MSQLRDDKLLLKIALVFKDLRDELGVSQEDVFNETDIHIGRIEAGTTNPTISTISKLVKYFNIRLSEFFQRVETRK